MTQVWPTEQVVQEYLIPCSPSDDWVYTDMKRYWGILDENVSGFMEEYTLMVNQHPELEFIFLEKSCNITPIMLDLKFYFDNISTSPFTGEIIQELVKIASQVLHTVYDSSLTEVDTACILMHNIVTQDLETGLWYCDFRLIFPNVITTARIIKEILVPRYIREVTRSKIQEMFLVKPNKNWEDIIRSPCGDLAISMYGSKCMNSHKRLFYSCTYKYDTETQLVNRDSLAPHHNWDGAYSVDINANFEEVPDYFQGDVPYVTDEEDEVSVYYLPYMLSHYYSPNSAISPKHQHVLDVDFDLENFARTTIFEKLDRREHIDVFVDMWSDSRFSKYHYWKTVGEAIYDAYVGSSEGLAHWIDITKAYLSRCNVQPRYLEKGAVQTCSKYYRTLKCDRVTIRSLAWHAREDSPEDYHAWHNNWIREAFEAAAYTKLHTDVAAAFYRMFWLDFMSTGTGKSQHWYHFYHGHLEETNENAIKEKLSTSFIRAFESMMIWMRNQESSASGPQRQKCGEIIESIAKLIEMLKTTGYRANIINEIKVYFDNPYMMRHINGDPELMGMINNVCVATHTEVFIRPGKPEDYITKSMGIGNYFERYSPDHPDVLMVEEWIAQMFVDIGLRRHFKKFLASLLMGGNKDKRFYVFTGVGNNSKSMLVEAIRRLFSDYCVKLDTAAFTRQRSDANSASPAFAMLDGARIVFTEEPEGNANFNAALVNNLTGIDVFNARMLHSNSKQIMPHFKLVMICNKIPNMLGGGKAIRNRLSAVPFLSTWIDNPPLDVAEQYRRRLFKIDTSFDGNLDQMMDPLFYVAMQNYQSYLTEGVRNETSEIRKATEAYWEESDSLLRFSKETLYHVCNPDGTSNMKASVSLDDAYDSYKIWFKANMPCKRQPDKATFEADMTVRLGPLKHGKWYSIVLQESMPNQEDPTKDEVPEQEEDLTSLSAGLLWSSKPLELLKPVYVTSEQLDNALKGAMKQNVAGMSNYAELKERFGHGSAFPIPPRVNTPNKSSSSSGSVSFFNPLASGIPLTGAVH